MKMTGARHLIIAAPEMPGQMLVELVNVLQLKADTITVVPNLLGIPAIDIAIDKSLDSKLVALRVQNNLANKWNLRAKRLFDIAAGIMLLPFILPVMMVIAIAIRLDSPGPILFSHRRVGINKSEFGCYKFRTMVINAQEVLDELFLQNPQLLEEWEKDFKLKKDPRITTVGRFLRKTSLDELPQIFNVLKGEMSFVGPRPIVKKEVPKFGNHIHQYYIVQPGITGLWQVSGRNDVSYSERTSLESWYVRNWSVWLDMTILLRTVGVIAMRKGAY
jgi:undecaprenyl-phosphate galactose phosphotransferase